MSVRFFLVEIVYFLCFKLLFCEIFIIYWILFDYEEFFDNMGVIRYLYFMKNYVCFKFVVFIF